MLDEKHANKWAAAVVVLFTLDIVVTLLRIFL